MLAARSGGWKTARGAEPEEASSLVAQLVPVLTGFWARIRVSPHPEEIHTLLEAMLGIGEIVTKCLVTEEERIETIELHLNLARAEDARGRPRQALYHANHAHTSLEFLSHGLRRGQDERVGELELQALVLLGRLQGQGNNLPRALFYLDRAQEQAELDEDRKLWRARIAAARGTAKVACGRFVLRDLEREIESVKPLLEKGGSEEERLLVEMRLHLAQAYIATENPDHAQFHLDAIRGLMRDSQRMGIMDYASYALQLASLWILQGREAGRIRHLVEDAEEGARRAGLESLERALRELKPLLLDDETRKKSQMT
jgi:tetratricopeptide (TPR) repeat protein